MIYDFPTALEDGLVLDGAGAVVGFVRVVPLTTAVGFGVDLKCTDDLDPALASTDPFSIETLAQDTYHRLTTRRETLPDDKDYGIDLIAMLHTGMTPAQLRSYEGQIVTELEKDDRIRTSTATVTPSADKKRLTVKVAVTPENPRLRSFELVIVVTDGQALLDAIR